MPGQVKREVKEKLKEAGNWPAFLQRRDQLKEEGYPYQLATDLAVKEFQILSNPTKYEPLLLAPRELAGKTAKEVEVIRWVFNNIDNISPDPKNCPSPGAWTLLRQCRENPGFQHMFIEKIWTKLIPSRAQLEENEFDEDNFDGKPTVELINRLRKIRDESNRMEEEKIQRHLEEKKKLFKEKDQDGWSLL